MRRKFNRRKRWTLRGSSEELRKYHEQLVSLVKALIIQLHEDKGDDEIELTRPHPTREILLESKTGLQAFLSAIPGLTFEPVTSSQLVRFVTWLDGRWIEYTLSSNFDSGGRIDQLRVCVQDVTERKRAEETLRDFEKRYYLLWGGAPVGVGIIDEEGNVLTVTPMWLETTGFSQEELKSVGIGLIYAERDEHKRIAQVLLRVGKIRDHKVWLKRKHGTIYPGLLNGDQFDLNRQKLFFITVYEIPDVTPNRRANSWTFSD